MLRRITPQASTDMRLAFSASTPRRRLRSRCWYSIQRSSSAGHTLAWLSEPMHDSPAEFKNRAESKKPSPKFASVLMRDANGGACCGDALELRRGGVGRVHQAPVPVEQARVQQQLNRSAAGAALQASTSFNCSATWMCTGRAASIGAQSRAALAASSQRYGPQTMKGGSGAAGRGDRAPLRAEPIFDRPHEPVGLHRETRLLAL